MTKNIWPVETPQIDITYIRGKWPSYFFYDESLLALEILAPKGIFGKQCSLWMDLEVSKISNVRRKVICLFIKDFMP